MATPDLSWLVQLLVSQGERQYSGSAREPVTAMAHALQCADLAAHEGAPPALVAAALLHDVGHLLVDDDPTGRRNDVHEILGPRLLEHEFPESVTEPIRLHVAAKRYLCAVEPGYHARLSPASKHSLELQGGPMTPGAAEIFVARRHAREAIALRRWDDAAKVPGLPTRPLRDYCDLLQSVVRAELVDPRRRTPA